MCQIGLVVMSGKKLLGKLKQYSILKSYDMYACNIQNWKFGSVLSAYPANSRKAYRKVCNNGIIDRFFVLNCEKDQKICQNVHRLDDLLGFRVQKL